MAADILVETFSSGEIVSEIGVRASGDVITDNVCLALDIGTTTLALALVSLDDKRIVKATVATNPERVFGHDIMTRIDYCSKNSVRELNGVLVREINRMIGEICEREVDKMFVAGNLTMLHIFFGIDCSSLGVAPYTPVFKEGKRELAADLGITGVRNVVSLPSVSAFVGADIVAGLNYVDAPGEDKFNLLIDLGTNAEVVLYSDKYVVATAAAAGPCFEGANISSGMSATDGAIYFFEINDGEPYFRTVGNKKAKGICGTGLIDIVAELLREGIIDGTGYMEKDYRISDSVTVTAGDIRQYQLAKSAIYSAVTTLMKQSGVGFSDIAKMYISGGFSAKININNAAFTGLLPRELVERAVAINNSSLLGTVKYATDGGNATGFCESIRYIDLSNDPYFAEVFIENMMFFDAD